MCVSVCVKTSRGVFFIDFERNVYLLFHLFMHSLVASYMCPARGSNLQLWRVGLLSNQLSYPARAILVVGIQHNDLMFVYE